MRNCIALVFLICGLCAKAQTTVDNFESGNKGWAGIEGPAELRSNDYKTGINLSNHILYTQRNVGANNWAGAILNNYSQTGYKYVHAYMYRNNTNVPNLKIFDTDTPVEFLPMNTIVAHQWQDVVFDISAYADRGTDFLFFMVDRTNISSEAWMLIDEVQLSNDAEPRTAIVGGDNPPVTPSEDYQLVWNEDFTDASLDMDVWNIETNGDGGGNNELQYYCDRGVKLDIEPTTGKHCLVLTATKENYQGKGCTSGRVNTLGKMYYTYGRIDARIKFPKTANGLWPAFWQMGNNYSSVGWPKCGETDIIELGHQNAFTNGTQERYFNGAMHLGSKWDAVWSDAQSVTWPYSVEDSFHIVTMIWTPTSIDMYMDRDAHPENGPYFHANLEPNSNADYNRQLVFGKPNFVIANLAVGGVFPGIYDINGITALAAGPRSMYIDWIRIYQRGDNNQSFVCPSPSDPIETEMTSGVEVIGNELQVTGEKVLYNGRILIRRGEHVYTITGQIVK